MSVSTQQAAFATGVLTYIYAFYRYTCSSTCLCHTLALQYLLPYWVEPSIFTKDLLCHLRTLTPNNSG